jgi:hypothetical protein
MEKAEWALLPALIVERLTYLNECYLTIQGKANYCVTPLLLRRPLKQN